MPQGVATIKDIISLFVYALFCSFRENKKAVLVYHSVDYITVGNDPDKINVNPELFEKHMAYISPQKDRFFVTFDDGYEGVYKNAFPIIKKYGVSSAVFLTTNFIDGKTPLGQICSSKIDLRPLDWAEIKEMNAAGMELGSHSLTHQNISKLDDEGIYSEATASKRRIEDMTGYKINSFSYPFGDKYSFNERTQGILKAAGYNKIYTNIMGMDNSDTAPLAIKRIRIYSEDNMFRFRMKIKGAYNWVDYLHG